MITRSNFPELLSSLDFSQTNKIYYKTINSYELKVDFANEKLIYPEGLKAQRDTTKNFSAPENFVVFECVHNLLQSGYKPEHIILEQGMPGGHGDTGGFCDIIVQDNDGVEYLLIECKTADDGKSREFSKAWAKMLKNGGQLFNYFNTYRRAKWLCLYCSDFRNDKVESIYHLISMTDNNDFLKNNDKLQSFAQIQAENGAKVDYFNVWTDTYQQDFITHNLFESEIFKVGNRPYNVNDLKIVDNDTIQKKYHQFATIMRQHNVSARENAFDKLVNIFLCKVVDEKANPENLKVYWKGAASDNHYDLQDRLQQLYKIGMKDFLGEEVTYISEDEINNAFHLFKNKKDETKRTVLEYFTQLKFYSNNPFAFLDVHNEKLFFQNAVILKEIVQMLQDIKLQNEEEQHQFLGDLFEGFLDQGVKQSEGQFFTPMPIVKFLISSLPLEQVLQNKNAPKVIDYACGAGHFLTEYASQIKPLLKDSGRNLSEFYQKIYGIEKEYRLSKVAKVSAFMYGQDEMNIIYADALAQNQEQGKALQDGSFSLLVANPPYSVKGFLSTISDEDKAKFTLYENIDNEETFNSIETFFIEKAKQLLHAEGIAVIVLPSSILTNGNIYIKCREILLQHFDLVAIAEFGSGTFSKTGTNTATLFLRRKQATPNLSEHYKNRIEQWQSGNFGFDGLFEDHYLLQSYCNHCGFNLDDYKAFLSAIEEMPSAISETELFQEYRKAFEKRKFAKSANLAKEWLKFAKDIESDKMKFFMLAQNNPQDVLVVKMPADNKEKKAFLGYEWSSAKGSEGIKYLNQISNDKDGSLAKLKGINQIQTPLFNPQNLFDETKINNLIRQNFNQQAVEIPQTLANYVSLLPLTQMLDFSRVDFDKAIRTSVQKKVEIVSKYPLQSIADIFPIIESGKRPSGGVDQYTDGAYSLGGEHIHKENGRLELKEIKFVPMSYFNKANKGIIQNNDILICKDGALTGKIAIIRDELNDVPAMVNEHVFILRTTNLITQKYAFHVLHSEMGQNLLKANITGAAQGGLNSTNLKNIKIPLPHLDIQTKIVTECEKIDDEFNRTRMQIEEYRAKISKIFNELEIARGDALKSMSYNYY
ncbi:TPA: N-6 DNA methylase [Haemophilus influenzae]|uniref:N-6 DNA methylase n=1 Tax=Haemophilus influenzae TaxID=727 RepID=UPI000D786E10|nr:N-6 DNA methylase [Haemophilus influenzae]BBF08723.1 restriction endonuclease [Haemophilus influenzae]GBK75628.1 restriction endonuclease [Haemophilus influenzae]